MVTIEKIEWSDESREEADVTISETSIPGDIFDGDMIEFTVSRLDIY